MSPDILGRHLDPKDPVNQLATIGLHGQVWPPATPHLNLVRTNETYVTGRIKNLAQQREQGFPCLKIFFIFLLIVSWYSDPTSPPRVAPVSQDRREPLRRQCPNVVETVRLGQSTSGNSPILPTQVLLQ